MMKSVRFINWWGIEKRNCFLQAGVLTIICCFVVPGLFSRAGACIPDGRTGSIPISTVTTYPPVSWTGSPGMQNTFLLIISLVRIDTWPCRPVRMARLPWSYSGGRISQWTPFFMKITATWLNHAGWMHQLIKYFLYSGRMGDHHSVFMIRLFHI